MTALQEKSIENIILALLQRGALKTAELIGKVNKVRPRTTKQGVYKALRKMRQQEVVIFHKQVVSLNTAWLRKMSDYFLLAEQSYLQNKSNTGNFLDLQNGERIRYDFRDAATTDAFWVHALHILVEAHPGTAWFGYNPHCWFFIAREASERQLRDFIIKKGGVYTMTVAGKTPLDRYISGEFDGKKSKYHMREKPLFPKSNYYLNVIGDFLIEVWIDPKTAAAVENIYKSTGKYSEEAKANLQTATTAKGRSKLIISKNKKRAAEFARRLSKPFYFER